MHCLRCGYCCQGLAVIVVDDPTKGIVSGNLLAVGCGQDGVEVCPHLRGDEVGEYSCAVHDEPWYQETPCAQYQSHWPERDCTMGKYMTGKAASPIELEDLG
jgi:hypothetical protein